MDWERDGLTRRSALARGFGGVALVCSFDFDKLRAAVGAQDERVRARPSPSGPFEPFQRDLPIPPVARPVARSRGRSQQYVLTMQPGTADILPGFKTPILGYDGLYPGPDDQGHPRARGRGPADATRAAARSTCTCTAASRGRSSTGTRTTRSRTAPSGSTSTRTSSAGDALVPRPRARRDGADAVRRARRRSTCSTIPADAELELPQGDYDVPLMIRTAASTPTARSATGSTSTAAYRGDTILVNGAVAPRMKVERRLYRLRFLNASNARPYALSLGNNRAMIQIAQRRRRCCRSRSSARRSRSSPAERVDVVVDFRPVRRRLEGDPAQHGRRGDHAGRHALRRRPGRRRGGARAEGARPSSETLPPVNAQRGWPLTFQGLGALDVADRRRRLRRDADRLPPAAGLDGAVDVHQQLPAHAPDAPARLPLPRRQHERQAAAPGRRGLEGHGRGVSQPDGRRAPVLRLLRAAATCSTATPPSTATCR